MKKKAGTWFGVQTHAAGSCIIICSLSIMAYIYFEEVEMRKMTAHTAMLTYRICLVNQSQKGSNRFQKTVREMIKC